MSDIPNDIDEPNLEQVDAILFQLVQLHDHYMQDYQSVNVEKEKLINASKLLIDKIKEIEKIEFSLSKNIQNTIQTSVNSAMNNATESIIQKMQFVEAILHKRNKNIILIVILTIISFLTINIATMKFLLPSQASDLSSKQLTYLHDGKVLADIWPNLSKTEKNHLKNLANNTLPL